VRHKHDLSPKTRTSLAFEDKHCKKQVAQEKLRGGRNRRSYLPVRSFVGE
jgi:hypothetical protein